MVRITEMSSESRQNIVKVIKEVEDNIEMCLNGYQKKSQVIKFLYTHENTEPRLTEEVWLKLEEEYPAFFKAYYTRILLKDQILKFNKLLVQQEDLMAKDNSMGTAPMLTSCESHVSPSEQILTPYVAQNSNPVEEEGEGEGEGEGEEEEDNDEEFACFINGFMPNFVPAQIMNQDIVNTEIARNAGSSHFSPPGGNLYESSPLIDNASFNLSPPRNLNGEIPLIGDTRVSCFGNGASNGHHGSKPLDNYGLTTPISDPGLLSFDNGASDGYHGNNPPSDLYESTPSNCDPLLSFFGNGASNGPHGNNPPVNLYESNTSICFPHLSYFGNGASIGHHGNNPPGGNLFESNHLIRDLLMPSTSNGCHGDNTHLFGYASSSGVLPQVPPNVDQSLNPLELLQGYNESTYANNTVNNNGDKPSESLRRRYQRHGAN